MESEKRIIEINGIKMEIDLRDAVVIDNYKVGDPIKVLIKSYGDNYSSYVGTIIGFDNFKEKPTVVIAYLETSYSSSDIKFVYFNSATKDVEITKINDWDIPYKRSDIMNKFDSEIQRKQQEIADIEKKKTVFEHLFGKYFDKFIAETTNI